jgi:small subunit ribosomal protein S20
MILAVFCFRFTQRESSLPNIKAAQKWAAQSEKRETRNRAAKSSLKTLFKRAVDSREAAAAGSVESAYDKAAAKGIIHPNKAARKKSRLVKAMRRAAATPAKTSKRSGRSKK